MLLAWILFALQVLLLIVGVLILFNYRRKGDGFKTSTSLPLPAVSVISSVKGISGGFDEGLACLWNQNYNGQIEIVLIIEDLDDPALAHLERMRTVLPANPQRVITLITGKKFEGSNPRNRKMLYGFEQSKHDWLLWHAIDTTFSEDYLHACVTLTKNEPMNYVSGFPINHSAQNFGAHLETTCLNLEVSRVFLMTLHQRDRGPVYGGAIFAHRSLYLKSGAFEIIPWRLTEDVIFGGLFAKAGAKRFVHPWPAYVRQTRQSFKAYCARQVRWMMIARYHMPLEYWLAPTSFLAPIFWLLALVFQSPLLLELGLIYFASRVLVAFATQVAMKLPKSDWWQVWNLIVYDLLNPYFWISAMITRRVVWAGDVMEIGPGGELRRSAPSKSF